MKFIDVSEHNGQIDWAVAKNNIDGAIIRAGYGKGNIDKRFHENISACNTFGIPCGSYWFSYAYTNEMAVAEAKFFLEAISKYKLELPVAYDFEYASYTNATNKGITLSAGTVKSMAVAFLDTLEKSNYYAMLYANPDYITKFFGDLPNRYDLWLAQWPLKKPDVSKPPRACGIWQWGTSIIPGVGGRVDTNESYKDYKMLINSKQLNRAPLTWSEKAMKWGKEKGIINDDRPSDAATRVEVVQMLKNFSEKFKMEVKDT